MTPNKRLRFLVTEVEPGGQPGRTLYSWEVHGPTWFNCSLAHGHYLVVACGYNQRKAAKKARAALEKHLDKPFSGEGLVQ